MQSKPIRNLEDFDFKVFKCVDLAFSTIGESEKQSLQLLLEKRHKLSGRDLAKYPARLDSCLKEILGPSVSAFLRVHILENISETFGLELEHGGTIEDAVNVARSKSQIIRAPIIQTSHRGGA